MLLFRSLTPGVPSGDRNGDVGSNEKQKWKSGPSSSGHRICESDLSFSVSTKTLAAGTHERVYLILLCLVTLLGSFGGRQFILQMVQVNSEDTSSHLACAHKSMLRKWMIDPKQRDVD